jgi:hypothetical protein
MNLLVNINLEKEWLRMLFWVAQISALSPNHSLRLFLLLDIKPFWPTFVATVLETHMIEVFKN